MNPLSEYKNKNTWLMTAPNNSGRCCEQAATRSPPFEPPCIANLKIALVVCCDDAHNSELMWACVFFLD